MLQLSASDSWRIIMSQYDDDKVRILQLEAALNDVLRIAQFIETNVEDLTVVGYNLKKDGTKGGYCVCAATGESLGCYSLVGAMRVIMCREGGMVAAI
jgi:hypothetical protein